MERGAAAPKMLPAWAPPRPAPQICCQRRDEPVVANPCHDSNAIRGHRAPKMPQKYIWCMKKHLCTYIFLCSKVQKLFERGKKSIGMWMSWRKRWMKGSELMWVQVQGCMLSWARLNTFLKASSSWSWTRIAVCIGKKKPFQAFLF